MSEKIDKKKNSETGGKDTPVSMDYSGIDKTILSELNRIGVLSQIEAVFKEKSRDFIIRHVYLNEKNKLVIKSLNKEYRKYIIGVQVNDISYGSNKYMLLNKFILVKIANYSTIYDSIEAGLSKPSDYIIKQQKNGSMRLQNVNRAAIEFEIQ